MIYVYVFIIAFLGALSGNFSKLGEANIGRAGGEDALVIPQLFLPALYIGFVTGFAPYISIIFVGFYNGWLSTLYAIGISILGAFLCGFLPFSIRHIVVFFSPLVFGWSFYQLGSVINY